MKVVVDTNVIISAMRSRSGASHAILLSIHRREIIPVISVPLLMEYEEVSKRDGMIPNLTDSQIDIVLNQICDRAIEQKIFFSWRPFLPDPDDDINNDPDYGDNTSTGGGSGQTGGTSAVNIPDCGDSRHGCDKVARGLARELGLNPVQTDWLLDQNEVYLDKIIMIF